MIRTIIIYYRSFSRAHMLVPESVQFAFEKVSEYDQEIPQSHTAG